MRGGAARIALSAALLVGHLVAAEAQAQAVLAGPAGRAAVALEAWRAHVSAQPASRLPEREPASRLSEQEPDLLFEDELDPERRDPWEDANRHVFRVNLEIERFVLDPISEAYQVVVPEPGRRALQRAFDNLNATSIFVNDVLQLRPKRAFVTTARFAINSTLGLAGLMDTAKCLGLPKHHADFGQTLARGGVPSGPYLVLPLFGPSTARDAIGNVVDGLFQPQFYLLGPAGQLVLGAGSGIATRDANLESLEALRQTSVDFYAAMRSAYLMHRQDQVGPDPVR